MERKNGNPINNVFNRAADSLDSLLVDLSNKSIRQFDLGRRPGLSIVDRFTRSEAEMLKSVTSGLAAISGGRRPLSHKS